MVVSKTTGQAGHAGGSGINERQDAAAGQTESTDLSEAAGRSTEAEGSGRTSSVHDKDTVDLRSTARALTTLQVRAKLAELDRKYAKSPDWPKVRAHLETLLSHARPSARHNAGTLIAQLSRLTYNDPALEKRQAQTFTILADINNAVFNNEIKLDTNFLDTTVTVQELEVSGRYQAEHPELFPFATERFDRDKQQALARAAVVAEKPSALTGVALYYHNAYRAFAEREGLDLRDPAQAARAKERWLEEKGGADSEVNLVQKQQLGWVGVRKAVADFVAKHGHAPSVQEFKQYVKDNHSVFAGMSLTVEGDAILAEFARHISVETAAKLLGELSAEDKVRLSVDKPSTIIAILLACLSLIGLLTGGGAPLAVLCGAAASGLFAFEMALDAESGHLTDDTAAHQRMLEPPKQDARHLYRHLDKRAASNRADLAGARTDFVNDAAASPDGTVRYPEAKRPVLQTEFGPVFISELRPTPDGAYQAVGYDDTGRQVTSTIKTPVVFDPEAPRTDAEAFIGEVVALAEPKGQADLAGRIITVAGLAGAPVAVRVDSVRYGTEKVTINGRPAEQLHLVISGRTPDGRTVTLDRTGATPEEITAAQLSHRGDRVSDVVRDRSQQILLAKWLGIDTASDPDTWQVTVQDYAELMGLAQNGLLRVDDKNMGLAQLQQAPGGTQVLAALQARFGDEVVDDSSDLLYVGDSRWADTSDLDLVRKKRPKEPGEKDDATVQLRPGSGTVTVGVVGVDYQGSSADLRWRSPAPKSAVYGLKVGVGKGRQPFPETLTIERGGKTTELDLTTMQPAELRKILEQEGILFRPVMLSGGTQMSFSVGVNSDGEAKVSLTGARGSRHQDVDDFYATVYGVPPANPVVPRRSVRIEGEPKVEVTSARRELAGEEVEINNRRITHYVALGLKIALTIGSFAARQSKHSGGGGTSGSGGELPGNGGTDVTGGGSAPVPGDSPLPHGGAVDVWPNSGVS